MQLEELQMNQNLTGSTPAANPSAKLWHKDFTLVVIGQIISLFGNAVLRFALPLYILQQSGSPALFGRISALAFLPMIVLAPVGGILADRVNKQRIMVVLDFLTAALIFGYIVVSGFSTAVAIVVVLMMALFAIQGAYMPTVQASIPLLAEPEVLVPANAAVNLVNSLSSMLGPVIGGVLYGAFGLPMVLIVSGICFFASAVMELFIRIPHKKQKAASSVWALVKDDMGSSLRFMFKEKPILAKIILIMTLFELCASSVIMIGLPVLVTQTFGLSSEYLGATQGVMMAGGLVGGLLAGVLAKKLSIQKVHYLLLSVGLCFVPIGVGLLLGVPAIVGYGILTAACFLAMIAGVLMRVQLFAYIQQIVQESIMAKVFSCLMALILCAQPVGQALSGWCFERFAAIPWVVMLAAALLASLVALYSRRCFGRIQL
jgi:MFS family permease